MNDLLLDLDGTLIDSTESILKSINEVLKKNNIKSSVNLDAKLNGLTLNGIFNRLFPKYDKDQIDFLINSFKNYYDDYYCTEVYAFPNIPKLLQKLKDSNINLYLITNKRMIPTMKILSHLGWTGYFSKVYCIDSYKNECKDKSSLISKLIYELKLNTNEIFYIGDTEADLKASSDNNIDFIPAFWNPDALKYDVKMSTEKYKNFLSFFNKI